jgi:protein TonB
LFEQSEIYERRVFKSSAAIVSVTYLVMLSILVMEAQVESKDDYQPLAVMEFANYDPDAGHGGASDNDLIMDPTPLPAQAEILPIEGISAPEPEAEPEEMPTIIESIAELAAPSPTQPPPPPEEAKPKTKEKPKLQARPQPAQAYRPGTVGASGEAVTAGGQGGLGAGGTGGGRGIGNPDLLSAYTARIQRQLNRHKKYPPEARSQGLAGVVTVNFSVNSQGQMTFSRLVKSSGHQALDNEAMALLRRVSPLPAMPKELNRRSLNMTVPIVFSVH